MRLILLLLGIATICQGISISNRLYRLDVSDLNKNPQVEQFHSFLQVQATQNANDYFDLNATEAATEKVQDALIFGVQAVINSAITDRKLSVAEYTVTQVRRVQRQVTGSGTNYKFEVTLSNSDGTTTCKANFTVFIKSSDQKKTVTSYNYQVQTTATTTSTTTTTRPAEPVEQSYTVVDQAVVNSDSEIQTCLNYGVSQVLEKAKSDGKLNDTTFSVPDVKKVEEQTVGTVTFYRISVELRNAQSNVSATFTVAYNSNTQQPSIRSLLYKVVAVRSNGVIATDAQGYTQIELLDVQNDATINANLQYGVSQIIEKALAAKKIPISVYTLTKINEAAKLMVGETTYYKFSIELGNATGTAVAASFTIKYNTKTTTKSLEAFSYQSRTATSN